ncbi:MAG: hypothetical protein HYT98_05260 [Candidatus Sungbacteria bacterium]|nr:hypothetical protein [Candidatus Sungbacteria bacterium]
MNPVLMLALLVLTVAVTAFITKAVTRVKPEKKVFGLDQLRGAKRYGAQTREQVRLVLAVVCGVCGYHNTVAEDVQKLVQFQEHDIQRRDGLIAEDENKINALRARIYNLSFMNKRSKEVITEAMDDLLLVQDSTQAC